MRNYTVTIYFNAYRDMDLVTLANQVGISNFKKIIKYSIRSLVDPTNTEKAKECYVIQENIEETPITSVRISINHRDDEILRKLLDSLKERSKGNFIKQLVRYTLGPTIILPLYLKEEIVLKAQTYTQLVITGLPGANTKQVIRKTSTPRKPRVVKQKEVEFVKKEVLEEKIQSQIVTPNPVYEPKAEENNMNINIFTTPNEEVVETETSAIDEADEILALLNNMLG